MAEDATLLTSQRNEVLTLLRTKGLDPLEFSWNKILHEEFGRYVGARSHVCSQLAHKRSEFYFIFGKWSVTWSPSLDRRIESESTSDWQQAVGAFAVWCLYLKREISAPDLWAELSHAGMSLPGDPTSNTPFSLDIGSAILARLEVVEAEFVNLATERDQESVFIREQFQYLRESVSRLGGFDWKNACVGVLTNLMTSGIFDPARGTEIFRWAVSVIGSALSNSGQLPPVQ